MSGREWETRGRSEWKEREREREKEGRRTYVECGEKKHSHAGFKTTATTLQKHGNIHFPLQEVDLVSLPTSTDVANPTPTNHAHAQCHAVPCIVICWKNCTTHP